MLYVNNEDKPGFIGRLGTVLGDAGLNIATFNLGRTSAGGDAIALVEVDQEVPAEVLSKVAGLPNVVQAKALNFRSEEHTSELQSLMRISYAVFCLKKKK